LKTHRWQIFFRIITLFIIIEALLSSLVTSYLVMNVFFSELRHIHRLEKLISRKYFSIKKKFNLIFKKIYFFYFEWKILSRSCEKFRNIILFADYNKFGSQTFDCYIFCFEYFFSISPLRIWFNLIFILTLVLIFMIVIYFSLIIFVIEIFYLSNLILNLLVVTYFIWNNL
jgi:hypothetical protein